MPLTLVTPLQVWAPLALYVESHKAWLTSPLLPRPQNAACLKPCMKTSHSILLIAITRLTKTKCSHQSRNVESPQNVGLSHRNAEQRICHLFHNLCHSPATTAAPRKAIPWPQTRGLSHAERNDEMQVPLGDRTGERKTECRTGI